ncbi:MAG: hypothetical protein EAZ15_02405 [Sphingobacteriales bacterium]|nr:MAG: hypothetical protein EAZ15_02405 [Sphingobacteriales bacterium]
MCDYAFYISKIGIAVTMLISLSVGVAIILATIAASSSYVAAPTAMKLL